MNDQRKVLIIEAKKVPDISEKILKETVKELENQAVEYKHIVVPDITEIAPTIRYAIRSMEMKTSEVRFIGYVVVGCAVCEKMPLHCKAMMEESIRGI